MTLALALADHGLGLVHLALTVALLTSLLRDQVTTSKVNVTACVFVIRALRV